MNVRSKAPTTRIKGVITAHKQAGTGAANAVVKPYGKTLSPQEKRLHQLLFVLPMNKGELLHCYTYITLCIGLPIVYICNPQDR